MEGWGFPGLHLVVVTQRRSGDDLEPMPAAPLNLQKQQQQQHLVDLHVNCVQLVAHNYDLMIH